MGKTLGAHATAFGALVVALALTMPVAEAQRGGKPRPSTLIGDMVRQETASETASVVGRFVSLRGGPIAARVGGAVDEVLVEIGDRVEKNQPLARLALDRLKAERQRRAALLNLASARIKTAKASLRLARQSANRLARLRNSAAFSEALLSDKQREAERAAAQVKEAEADYARARAELRLADVDLAYAEIKAPYAGVVTERHADVGGFVALGAPVVTLVGDKALEIEAEAPSDRMGGVRPGALAVVMHRGVEAQVPIRAVLPRETGVSRTQPVRFGPVPPALAKVAIANAAVTLRIPAAGASAVVTIDKDAVVRRPNGATVVVAAANAKEGAGKYKAEIRPIELGPAVGQRFVVVSGVSPGEIVVTRGNERLRPGAGFNLAEPRK